MPLVNYNKYTMRGLLGLLKMIKARRARCVRAKHQPVHCIAGYDLQIREIHDELDERELDAEMALKHDPELQ